MNSIYISKKYFCNSNNNSSINKKEIASNLRKILEKTSNNNNVNSNKVNTNNISNTIKKEDIPYITKLDNIDFLYNKQIINNNSNSNTVKYNNKQYTKWKRLPDQPERPFYWKRLKIALLYIFMFYAYSYNTFFFENHRNAYIHTYSVKNLYRAYTS